MMDTKNLTQETYSTHFIDYIKKFELNGSRTKDIEETLTYCKKDQPHIVELGCAGGRDALDILKYTKNYIGIDYIREFIDYAKQIIPDANFFVNDLETYTPPQDTDIVFAFASLLHSDKESLQELFLRIHNTLSENGLVRLSIKSKESYSKVVEKDPFGERIFYYYSEKDIREITSQFKIIFIRQETHAGKDWLEILLQK